MVGLRGGIMWTYPERFHLVNVGRAFGYVYFFETMRITNDFNNIFYSKKKLEIIWHLLLSMLFGWIWLKLNFHKRVSITFGEILSSSLRLQTSSLLRQMPKEIEMLHHWNAFRIVLQSVGALEHQQRWCLKVKSSRDMKTFRLARWLCTHQHLTAQGNCYLRAHINISHRYPDTMASLTFYRSISSLFLGRILCFHCRFSYSLQSPVPACSHTAWNWANCAAVMRTVNLD